jgi:hypothetical protein
VNGQFAVFSVQVLYGLLVPICVVAGAHLVKLSGTKWQRSQITKKDVDGL